LTEKEILQRALERQKKARRIAEQILEHKSLELYNTAQELKKVNHKLKHLVEEKNSQLKAVFETINDPYFVMDLDGMILKMNDLSESFFGYNLNTRR
jgi:PAS domain-containing protein